MKPRVRTHLCISGNALNFDEITYCLGIFPTKVRSKDDYPEVSKMMGYAHDEWIYSTPKVECRSVSTQIDALEKIFENCVTELSHVCKMFNAKITIIIEIEMEIGNHPELSFTKENISFISSINSEIGIDPYINAGED